MIEDSIVRVAKQDAMFHLKPKLNGFRRYWSRVYVGVTCNPEGRWARHAARGWVKMVLVYEAYTPDVASELETDLIDYARRCNFRIPIENIGDGGEGLSTERRSNFLYVLVGN